MQFQLMNISRGDQSFRATNVNFITTLLLSKISLALKAEITESLYKFLESIEEYGSIDSKTVITAIRKKLLTSSGGSRGGS